MSDIQFSDVVEPINHIDQLYTTVSGGRLHIAADTKYIGSLDSYNNLVTQFFAWLFRRSIAVDFDGNVFSINKRSYDNLLFSLVQANKIHSIQQRSIFRGIVEIATLPTGNLKMRDVISTKTQKDLFKKLAVAISTGNTQEALSMVGKGAALDTAYYDRSGLSPSFAAETTGLKESTHYQFSVFHATPILQAARRGNLALCQMLKNAGADLFATGKSYIFERNITDVEVVRDWVYRPVIVSQYHHYHNVLAQEVACVKKPDIIFEWQLEDRTIIKTEDVEFAIQFYQLDPLYFSLTEKV